MTLITSPLVLWKSLISDAGLELRLKGGSPGRDVDIEEFLREALAVPEDVPSFEAWLISDATLSQPTVSTEQLLIEVLKSQGGFAQMMQDILDILNIAQAQQSSHQLSIEFKFESVSDPIKLALENFREIVNRIDRVLEKRPVLPDCSVMWNVWELIGKPCSDNRPEGFPVVPKINSTGQLEIDIYLDQLSGLVSDFRSLFRQHGNTRKQINETASSLSNIAPDKNKLIGQLRAGGDYWDVGILAGAQELSSQVVSGQLASKDALDKLADAFSQIEWREIWVERTVQELLDVLRLPIWKRRHELYSVWVGTRMLAVVKCVVPDMSFHLVNDVLSFEFGGSRLASFFWKNKQFDIWAERRTELVGPSKKRTKGIQPDYRVLQVDNSKSENTQTTYVIECKHYLKVNTSNFINAAADYARSCPNAIVHIVNHGHTDEQALKELLPANLQSRTQFIGSATPLLNAKNQVLSNAIRDTLFPDLLSSETTTATFTQVESSPVETILDDVDYAQIVWDGSLDDMDLSLRVLDANNQELHSIDFSNKGSLDTAPYARLNSDERHGPGQERIDFSRWPFSKYELIATNYSKSGLMTPAALYCDIKVDNRLFRLRCPEGLKTTCYEWKICELIIRDGIPAIVLSAS